MRNIYSFNSMYRKNNSKSTDRFFEDLYTSLVKPFMCLHLLLLLYLQNKMQSELQKVIPVIVLSEPYLFSSSQNNTEKSRRSRCFCTDHDQEQHFLYNILNACYTVNKILNTDKRKNIQRRLLQVLTTHM